MGLGIDNVGTGVPNYNPVEMPPETGRTGSVSSPASGNVDNPNDIARQMAGRGPNIDGAQALRNAEVKDLAQELRDMVPARHTLKKSVWNVFKSIGRAVMKTCHAIRNTFAFAPPKRSRAEFQSALESRHPEAYAQGAKSRVGVWTERPGNLISYGTNELGTAMGLRENIRTKPFSKAEIETIRNGQFKLSDITQDPNLENCWFLGTLVSFLTAKGAGAIQDLISLPPDGAEPSGDTPLMAQVKLGGEVYEVPLAEICDDRGIGGSKSAPWVKLLETAMQMHLMNLHEKDVDVSGYFEKEKVVDMSFGCANVALGSLLGDGTTVNEKGKREFIPRSTDLKFNLDVDAVEKAVKDGRPAMILTSGSFMTSFGTGLSPNHCVSVQDVVKGRDGKTYFQILDPYNRSVLVSADCLLDASVVIEKPSKEPAPQFQRRDSLASTTAQFEAPVSRSGDDF